MEVGELLSMAEMLELAAMETSLSTLAPAGSALVTELEVTKVILSTAGPSGSDLVPAMVLRELLATAVLVWNLVIEEVVEAILSTVALAVSYLVVKTVVGELLATAVVVEILITAAAVVLAARITLAKLAVVLPHVTALLRVSTYTMHKRPP